MSPRRVIDGDVIHDPDFAGMSWLAQLLWYRLWDVADSWGRGVWDPLVLKVNCFPLNKAVTDAKVKGAMDEIAAKYPGIGFYEAKKQQLFHLLDWERVVNPKHRKGSWIPAPTEDVGKQMKLATQRQSTENQQKAVPGIGVGVDIGVGTGGESPSGKKLVDKLTRATRKELEGSAAKDAELPWDELRLLSPARQAAAKAFAERQAKGAPRELEREKLTDEQICEKLGWTQEELKHKRAVGITREGDVEL